MSGPGEESFVSRFTLKFVEIVAAGVATAISGYLIAHLGGFLSSPAPAAVEVAPMASTTQRANPAPIVSADAKAERPAPQRDAAPAAAPPARPAATAAEAAPSRKRAKTETSATASKPREADSIEGEIRAALAHVDADRTPAPDPRPHQAKATLAPGPTVLGTLPLSINGAPINGTLSAAGVSTGSIAAATPTAVAPRPQQPAPVLSNPPAAVEIKSLPVANVDPSTSPAPQQPAQQVAVPSSPSVAAGAPSPSADAESHCCRRSRRRTTTCSPRSSACPICCAPTHRRRQATCRVRRWRSASSNGSRGRGPAEPRIC